MTVFDTALSTGSPQDLEAVISELAPGWRSRLVEADRTAQLSTATVDECRAHGLFSLCVPQQFGGLALPWRAVATLTAQAGAACPATAWMMGLVGNHAAIIARMPGDCQEDVFGASAHGLVATASVQRGCDVVRSGPDLVVSGKWSISSGIDIADWVVLYMRHPQLGEEPYLAAVPVADVGIVEDWDVVGLRATGSKSIEVASVRIPPHRVIAQAECFGANPPGAALNPGRNYYSASYLPFLSSAILGPAIGAAQGGFDTACRLLKSRYARLDPSDGERVTLELAVSESEAELYSATLLMSSCLDILSRPDGGFPETPGDDAAWAQLRRDKTFAVIQCNRALDRVIEALGTSGLFSNTLPQIYWRDLKAMSKHIDVHWTRMMRPSGQRTLAEGAA